MIRDVFYISVGLLIGAGGVFFMFSGRGGMWTMFGLVGIFVCGLIIARRGLPYITDALGISFYYSHDQLSREPEQLSRLEGMAFSGQAGEAAAELEEIVAKQFNNIEARMLLARIRQGKLDDARGAEELLEKFFKSPRHVSGSASLNLLLFYGDLLYDARKREKAVSCYEHELARGKFSTSDRDLLLKRLAALKDS